MPCDWHIHFCSNLRSTQLTLSQFGEIPCVMGRTHQKCQLPSLLSYLPNHLFCQKVVELVIAWKGKSMGKFELGRAPSFGMPCFTCRDKKTLEPYASLTHAFTFCFYSQILGDAGYYGSFIHHLCSPCAGHCGSGGALPVCVSFTFCECFSLGKTMITVLQC